MVGKRPCLVLLIIFWVFLFKGNIAAGPVVAQQPDEAGGQQVSTQEPTAMPSSTESSDQPSTQEPTVMPSPAPTESSDQLSTPESSAPASEPAPLTTPALELTTAGWLESDWLAQPADVSIMALASVDCAVMTPPVVGFEISRGQDPDDIADFVNDLTVNGFSVGAVDISGGVIPACLDVLVVLGSVRGGGLALPYSPADGTLLRGWAASGHGLMIAGEFGNFRAGTQALFQAYGYSQQGAFAVSDPTDFDPPGPANSWVIYQADNFDLSHPILSGVTTLELLASSSLAPDTNAIVTTDADALPPTAPVMTAFTDGAGCVALATDTNWLSVIRMIDGYFKADNARVARQMVQWLNGCTSLKLSKLAGPSPVQAGGLLTYTLTARNDSASPITGIVITDTVPLSATFINATSPFIGPDANDVVTWPLGALSPNSSATVSLIVQVNNAVATGTIITNTAWITSNEGLTDTASALTPVNIQLVDPGVTKAASLSQAQVGDVVTFTLTVQQTPGSTANGTNVQIVDPLPQEVDILGVEVTAGFTTIAGQVVTWTIPILTPTDVRVMTIRTQVNNNANPPQTILNQAALNFDQGPARQSNPVEVALVARTVTPTTTMTPTTTVTPPSTSIPTPTDTPDSGDNDDDDGGDPDREPATATPGPALAVVATSTPAPVLPVTFLPETGQQVAFWPEWRGLAWGIALLAMTLLLLKFKRK